MNPEYGIHANFEFTLTSSSNGTGTGSWRMTSTAEGTYTFYFGVDTTMDGALTMDVLSYDSLAVIVDSANSSKDTK